MPQFVWPRPGVSGASYVGQTTQGSLHRLLELLHQPDLEVGKAAEALAQDIGILAVLRCLLEHARVRAGGERYGLGRHLQLMQCLKQNT